MFRPIRARELRRQNPVSADQGVAQICERIRGPHRAEAACYENADSQTICFKKLAMAMVAMASRPVLVRSGQHSLAVEYFE